MVSIFDKSVVESTPEDLDVCVIDTEARELESKTARKKYGFCFTFCYRPHFQLEYCLLPPYRPG